MPHEEGDGKHASGAPDSALVQMARYSGHGLTIALATGGFLLAGWWVDGKLGTTPLFTILGALVGAAGGFYSLLQHVLFLPRREAEERMRKRADADSPGIEDDEPR